MLVDDPASSQPRPNPFLWWLNFLRTVAVRWFPSGRPSSPHPTSHPHPPVEKGSGGTGGGNNNPLIGIILRPLSPRIYSGSRGRESSSAHVRVPLKADVACFHGSGMGDACRLAWCNWLHHFLLAASLGRDNPPPYARTRRRNPAHERFAVRPGSTALPRLFRFGSGERLSAPRPRRHYSHRARSGRYLSRQGQYCSGPALRNRFRLASCSLSQLLGLPGARKPPMMMPWFFTLMAAYLL